MWSPQSKPVQTPLPAGWEAKYDPNARKWFYLNHFTKTTQWDDPRLTLQQPRGSSNYGATTYGQSHSPKVEPKPTTTSFIEADPSKVKKFISIYEVDEELVKTLLRVHNNKDSKVDEVLREMGCIKRIVAKEHFVTVLRKQYDAPASVLRDALVKSNNSLQGARLGLEALNYKRAAYTTTTTKSKQSVNKAVAAAIQRPVAKTPSKPAKPAKPAVDPIKAKMEIKKAFPQLDDSTIDMCLKVADYDIELTKSFLKIKEVDDKQENKGGKMTKTTEVEETTPRDFTPKRFGDDDGPSTSHNQTNITSVVDNKEKSSDLLLGFLNQNAKETSPVSVRTKQYQQRKVARVFAKRTDGYRSSLRIEPVGPNQALCKGPDPQLLLKVYVARLGPSKANSKGPQRSNRCGPHPGYHRGPANIAMGPMASVV